MTVVLVLLLSAVTAYLLGCTNGAILVSRVFFHEDVRKKGSGNAGLTNFYRVYGAKCVGLMISVDVLKTVLSVLLGSYLFGKFLANPVLGKYWAGVFVVLGHSYPCMFSFRGGKGILCSGTLLILLHWQIALIGFALFFAALLLTKYVSLGSVLAAVSFPFTTYFVYRGQTDFPWIMAISVLLAASVLWSHRGNIGRLLKGTENKFRFHRSKE